MVNHYFCSVFAKENISNLPHLRSLLWPIWSTPSTADVVFDVDEVYKVLCRIDSSKACGPDEIPGQLLREEHHGLRNPFPNCIPCLCSPELFLEIRKEPMLLQCLRGVINTPLPTIALSV